jgi:hypothetical protein
MFRKIPTRAELDRAEQSLTRVRTDLASKRSDLTSLKIRAASQPEVGDRRTDLGPSEPFFPLQGAQKSSWLAHVAPSFRGGSGTSTHRGIVYIC